MYLLEGPLTAYVVAGGVALLFLLLASSVYYMWARGNVDRMYDSQLEELMRYETEESAKGRKIDIVSRWNLYWGNRFKESGWSNYSDENNTAGRDVFIGMLTISIIVAVLSRNVIAGFIIGAAILALVNTMMKTLSDRKESQIASQLPGFLFSMKANIQAGRTPEQAILKAVDFMQSPLYDDLLIVKQRLLSNATFQTALIDLSEKTSSRELKFLAACMIQGTKHGANLENQITKIQATIDSRRIRAGELDRAVKSMSPAIWIASITIPGIFIFTYLFSAPAREFWFHSTTSWILLGAVGAMYAGSMFLVRRIISSVKSL